MTKDEIQTKIRNLEAEDGVLRSRLEEIRNKYARPSQWVADAYFKAISGVRTAIRHEIEDLQTIINEIEDQEWANRQAENYPDGQV